MRKMMMAAVLTMTLMACNKKNTNVDNNNNNGPGSASDTPCGDHKSQQLYKESDGDCYLMENGTKKYVEKHECDC